MNRGYNNNAQQNIDPYANYPQPATVQQARVVEVAEGSSLANEMVAI